MNSSYHKHRLKFRFPAGTSRGVLKERDTWIIKVESGTAFGLGECSPLPGLSIETVDEVEGELARIKRLFVNPNHANETELLDYVAGLTEVSSVRFGLETALLDLHHGGNRQIFNNSFSRGMAKLPVNGLIWMGESDFMKNQVDEKVKAGYTCIKIKIGAIDFEEELSLLQYIRHQFPEKNLTIRVDANGAFKASEALDKLKALAEFNIHSIEQPVAAGQYRLMSRLCQVTPVPIALDEELVGISTEKGKEDLLDTIKPQFLIFKPSLVGGIRSVMSWIKLAEERNIGWWITSALESNIGLNAIAQLTAQYEVLIPQGLGTGQLYNNNIESPLKVEKGLLELKNHNSWNYNQLRAFY